MKSTQEDSTQHSQKGKPLNLTERKQIERWLKEKVSVQNIALNCKTKCDNRSFFF